MTGSGFSLAKGRVGGDILRCAQPACPYGPVRPAMPDDTAYGRSRTADASLLRPLATGTRTSRFPALLPLRSLPAMLPPSRHCSRCRIPDLGRFRCRRRRETPGWKTGTDCRSTNFDAAIGSGHRNGRRLRRRNANSPKLTGSVFSVPRPPARYCWGLRHIRAPTKAKPLFVGHRRERHTIYTRVSRPSHMRQSTETYEPYRRWEGISRRRTLV